MKIKKTILLLTLIVLLLSLPGVIRARDKQEGIPLSQVPKKVIKAAKKEISGIRLLDAKIITEENGQIIYMLDGAVGQKAFEVMVDSKGNVLPGGSAKVIKNDVSISRVPGNILLAARKEVKGLKVIKAKIIEGKDGKKFYEIEGVRGQKTYRISIGLLAEIIESELVDKYLNILSGDSAKEIESDVSISRVPGNILLAARKEVKGLKVVKAKIIEKKNGKKFYEIKGRTDRNTYRMRIGLSAEIIESKIVDK